MLAMFLKYLSALRNYKVLIIELFDAYADTDRCFSTFIFLKYRDYISCIICLFSAKKRRIMTFFSANVWIVGGIVVILQPKY